MTHEDGQAWRVPDTPSEPGAVGDPAPPPDPQGSWAAPGGSTPAPGWSAPGSGAPAHGPAPHGPPPGYGRPWAPRPGVVALRPLTLGDIFNGAFGYVRDNPKATLGLTAIIMAIVALLPAIGSGTMLNDITAWSERLEDPGNGATLEFPFSPFTLLLQFGGVIVDFIGSAVLTGLLAAVVGLAVLGRKLSMRSAWSAVVPRLGGVLGVAGLLLLYSLGVLALAFGVGALLVIVAVSAEGIGAGGWVAGAFAVVLLPGWAALSAWIYIRISMAMPVTVLERIGPAGSVARSWRLTQGSWWRVFAILLVATLLGSVVASMLSGPFSLIGGFSDIVLENRTVANVVYATMIFLGTVVGGIITTPFVTGVTTLLYVDLRMRREGLDLKLQAATQSGEAIDADVYLPEASPSGPGHPGPPGSPGSPAGSWPGPGSPENPGHPAPGRPDGQPGAPL